MVTEEERERKRKYYEENKEKWKSYYLKNKDNILERNKAKYDKEKAMVFDDEPTEEELEADLNAIVEGRYDDIKLLIAVIRKLRPIDYRKAIKKRDNLDRNEQRRNDPVFKEYQRKFQRARMEKIKANPELYAQYLARTRAYHDRLMTNPEYRLKRKENSRKYYDANRDKILVKQREADKRRNLAKKQIVTIK